MKKTASLIALFSVVFIANLSFLWADSGSEKNMSCPSRVRVQVEKVTPVVFLEHRSIKKQLLPSLTFDIRNEIAGIVKEIRIEPGSQVKAGDVILIIDSDTLTKELSEAEANLKQWQRILFQRQNWKERSENAEKQAKNRLAEAEELVNELQKMISSCQVTAPADGFLGLLKVNVGDHVSEAYLLGLINEIKPLKIVLTSSAERVSEGQRIDLFIEELNKTHTGVVVKNQQSTEIIVENNKLDMLAGMTASFRVLWEDHENGIVIKQGKYLEDEQGAYVYTVNRKNGRAKKNHITLGPLEEDDQLVLAGLTAGDELIVAEILAVKEGIVKDGFPCLEEGKKIRTMVFDPSSGRFTRVKIAPGKTPAPKMDKIPETIKVIKTEPIKTEKEVKPAKEKRTKERTLGSKTLFDRLELGAIVSYYRVFDSVFDSVYGSMNGLGADVSYELSDKLDIWSSIAFSSKSKSIEWSEEPLKFSFMPVSLNLRYFFKKSDKWKYFAGAGFNLYPFKDINPIEEISDMAFGFNAVTGTYYKVNKKISMRLMFRLNLTRKSIENTERGLNMNSAELLFGFSYNL